MESYSKLRSNKATSRKGIIYNALELRREALDVVPDGPSCCSSSSIGPRSGAPEPGDDDRDCGDVGAGDGEGDGGVIGAMDGALVASGSHRRTVPSKLPDAILVPSGLQAIQLTASV